MDEERKSAALRIEILHNVNNWRIRVRDTVSHAYSEERDAVSVAFAHARNLGKQGFDVEVAMKVLTCRFGPEGMIGTFPTPIRRTN